MLVYNNKIMPVIFDEEETENLPPNNEPSGSQSQNTETERYSYSLVICIYSLLCMIFILLMDFYVLQCVS